MPKNGCPPPRLPEKRFDASSEIFLNYREEGSGDRVIVALHGYAASLDTWKCIAPEWVRAYRVFLVDIVGFGLSARPKEFGYTFRDQAEVMASFVESVYEQANGRPITIVGHSYGAAIALATCAVLKDRQRPLIDSLIVIDALAFPRDVLFPAYLNVLRVPIMNTLLLNLLPPKLRSRIALKELLFRKELITEERICRYAEFNDLPGGHYAMIKTIRQLGNRKIVESYTSRHPEVEVPTLIIWGSHDKLFSRAQADKLSKTIPRCVRVAFVESGHLPHEEVPQETAQLMHAFLGSLPRRGIQPHV